YTNVCLEKREAKEFLEAFSIPVSNTDSVEDNIIRIYNDILDRYPNSKELIHDSRKILANKLTYDTLKQRLIDSDEYSRIIKLQSNSTTPELTRMISDKSMFTRITYIYFKELNRDCPKYMIYPLKDILIRFDYNENALRAVFRNFNYNYFEQDVKFIKGLDHKQLMDLFDTYFNVADILQQANMILPDDLNSTGSFDQMPTRGDNAVIQGNLPQKQVLRTVNDTDSNSQNYIKSIAQNANTVFNKDLAASKLPTTTDTIPTILTNNPVINTAIKSVLTNTQSPTVAVSPPAPIQLNPSSLNQNILPPNTIQTSALKSVVVPVQQAAFCVK
ncbi:MAG: hypothetical protein EBS55_10020, partial [Flavobacteriaceae bacterium]|nr:hypothetical protein [Flavobacteriaceae bacterium]